MIDIEKELAEILDSYKADVVEMASKAAESAGRQVAADLRAVNIQRRPRYRTQWATKKGKLASGRIKVTVYNKKDYRLTHLLEYGHPMPKGGRSPAIPHIKPIEKKYTNKYVETVVSALKKRK